MSVAPTDSPVPVATFAAAMAVVGLLGLWFAPRRNAVATAL